MAKKRKVVKGNEKNQETTKVKQFINTKQLLTFKASKVKCNKKSVKVLCTKGK